MFGASLTERLNKRLTQRVAATSTTAGKLDRFDLQLWDHKVLEPNEARILVGYSTDLGLPTRSDVSTFVMKNFGGRVRAILESVRSHNERPLITAHVIQIPMVIPVDQSRHMIRIAGDAFMDENEAVWNVRKSEKGERFLMRSSKEDIDQLLTNFEKTTKTAAVHHRPTLSEVDANYSIDPEVGDRVAVSHEGSVLHGTIQSMYPNGTLKIAANGKEIKLEKSKILEVKQVPTLTEEQDKKKMFDFFAEAYGDKGFAQKFVYGKFV